MTTKTTTLETAPVAAQLGYFGRQCRVRGAQASASEAGVALAIAMRRVSARMP